MSKELDPETLDEFLSKNKKSLEELEVFEEQLEHREKSQRDIKNEGMQITLRLAALQKRIRNATFEEKYQAISELVKSVTVNNNQGVSVVTITYRFNQPAEEIAFPSSYNNAVVENRAARGSAVSFQSLRLPSAQRQKRTLRGSPPLLPLVKTLHTSALLRFASPSLHFGRASPSRTSPHLKRDIIHINSF